MSLSTSRCSPFSWLRAHRVGTRRATRCTPAASSAVLTQALAFLLYLLVRPDRGALFQERQESGVSSGSAAIRAGQGAPFPPERTQLALTSARPDCRRRASNWSRRPRVVAETWRRPPARNRRPPTPSTDRRPLETTICTSPEPRCSHCQSTTDDHIDGPPLGSEQPEHCCRSGRRQVRRLVSTATDELTRTAIKAISSGGLLFLAYWWNRH
ncbi:hypothetical protein Strvi_9269 (plasmid) [Streptomyces violaceusniger Tu 4113]|uniref:Uncharacterized protein n=1 Tax=Streptomyces violaceusniger (strain Tu 4113) TaxID=653045 RepID=G2PGQ8_STRV4|nr:hypothetical protein Strvi_9269 [Streptomyces violaceusniger Tu 4113]